MDLHSIDSVFIGTKLMGKLPGAVHIGLDMSRADPDKHFVRTVYHKRPTRVEHVRRCRSVTGALGKTTTELWNLITQLHKFVRVCLTRYVG